MQRICFPEGRKPLRRRKVAYVIGSLQTGGAERQLLELIRGIDKSRFEVAVVLFDSSASRKNCEYESFDLRIESSVSRWRLKGAKAAAAVVRLHSYLRAVKPDVVHAFLPASCILAAPAAKFARVPVLIGSRRSLVDSYRKSTMFSLVDSIATRRCDFMLGNSDAIRRELIELDGVPSNRVATIYNGVDTDRFRPGDRSARQKYGWTDEHVVFGVVANFIPYKRHIDFVHAAALIASANPNARFVMAGEDRGILNSLRAEIRRLGLESLFTIIPGTDKPEELYPALDVYICTSETEGLSNVLLEACACGVPIVATRVGGNPEIVIEGQNGFLVEPKKPEAIAAAALTLADNPNLRAEISGLNRERIVNHFSMNEMVRAHEDLYERMLAGPDRDLVGARRT